MDKMDAALKKHASENGEEVREQVKVLMSRRGQLKRVITVTLKTIHKGGYNDNVIQQQVEKIKGKLKEIEDYDYQIMMLLQENGVAEEEPELHEQETESQVKYQMSVQGEIDQLQLGKKSTDKQEERNRTDASHLHCEKARLKEVKLPVFSGDQVSQMEFSVFFGLF